MADSTTTSGAASLENTPKVTVKADTKPNAKPPKPPNPAWKYLGLPNMRIRLPSRNWMIFLSITGSFSGAVIYDRREKRRAQKKWCKLVEHLALEPIEPRTMPRKLTIFLENPPDDGLRVAQDHFKSYIKPILVASGVDWEFVQGRREGDVRAELAEKIRTLRRTREKSASDEEDPILRTRQQNGTKNFEGPAGDIVIGRNTWKEYIRGLHEGWLGPLELPTQAESKETLPDSEQALPSSLPETLSGITIVSTSGDESTDNTTSKTEEKTDTQEQNPKRPPQPKPTITTSAYHSSSLPTACPQVLDPAAPISFPHILGFRHTPVRTVRFLNQRFLADEIGRDIAAIILSSSRPFHDTVEVNEERLKPSPVAQASPTLTDLNSIPGIPAPTEQTQALVHEEADWPKSVHKPNPASHERTWLDPMVLDPRIAQRMRRPELDPEDEQRARSIVVSEEDVEGFIKGSLRQAWKAGRQYIQATRQEAKGPNVGDISNVSLE